MVGQLVIARSITYGLEANQDLPMTKQEQKKGANDAQIKQTKKQMMAQIKAHREGISHPWLFEEYMGLGHIFDMPKGVSQKPGLRTAKEIQHEELRAREERISARLEAWAERHGNVDLRGAQQPTIPPLAQ